MTRNTSNDQIVADRRRRVAALRLRGMTQREIVTALARSPDDDRNPGMINPETGEPYSIATINRDLKALERRWQRLAERDITVLKAEQLAELKEAKRYCWATGDMSNLVKIIKLETEIVGSLAPRHAVLTIDWRAELEGMGFNAAEEYEELVRDLSERLALEAANQ